MCDKNVKSCKGTKKEKIRTSESKSVQIQGALISSYGTVFSDTIVWTLN